MKGKYMLWIIGFVFLCGAVRVQAQYLVPGIGVENVLEIGQVRESRTDSQGWEQSHGLQYKVDDRKRVVLIKCEIPDFTTDKNIRVGSPETDVLRRYGAPRGEDQNKKGDEVLYRYPGIGFMIRKGQVAVIYIFPRYKQKS